MATHFSHSDSVRKLFDTVAPHYDFLNHLLSFRRDISWRRAAVQKLNGMEGWVLDVATGTGDVVIELIQQGTQERRVWGIDFSEPMVRGAQRKLRQSQLSGRIALSLGDALALPFRENTFCASVMAFGLRNVPEKGKALSEMIRVTQWGGKVIVLEFTFPRRGPMRILYPFYFKKILPWVGGVISGDQGAYSYLPESVSPFRDAQQYTALMVHCGLENVMVQNLTFGIAALMVGIKPQP